MKKIIHIKPNARESGVLSEEGNKLEVAVMAPPVDGKANEELILTLANYFEVAKSSIEIIKGHTSRTKIIEIRPWQKR